MKLKTRQPSKRWREHANKNNWTRSYCHPDVVLENLKKRLLSIGGWSVCLQIDNDAKKILNRGRKFAGRAKMMRGEPCQCHTNSANLWNENSEVLQICTGYALSKDGMWRQHSWCVLKTPKSYKVVETTVSRVSYYGFILQPAEAINFYLMNY